MCLIAVFVGYVALILLDALFVALGRRNATVFDIRRKG